MRKLILFTILFALFSTVQAQVNPTLDQRTGEVNADSIVVGTTAVRITSHPTAAWVQFMHEDATATIWLGGSDVSALNGWAALKQYDTTERYPVTNTNVFYAISDEAGTVLHFLWGTDGRTE